MFGQSGQSGQTVQFFFVRPNNPTLTTGDRSQPGTLLPVVQRRGGHLYFGGQERQRPVVLVTTDCLARVTSSAKLSDKLRHNSLRKHTVLGASVAQAIEIIRDRFMTVAAAFELNDPLPDQVG